MSRSGRGGLGWIEGRTKFGQKQPFKPSAETGHEAAPVDEFISVCEVSRLGGSSINAMT